MARSLHDLDDEDGPPSLPGSSSKWKVFAIIFVAGLVLGAAGFYFLSAQLPFTKSDLQSCLETKKLADVQLQSVQAQLTSCRAASPP